MMTVSEAAWLYALLARLDKPLHGGMAAAIRQLFKLTVAQRAALCARGAGNAAHAAALSTLAAVAGRFFEQAMPGEW
jgi:survival of motor neuron protein-interacting protein 1